MEEKLEIFFWCAKCGSQWDLPELNKEQIFKSEFASEIEYICPNCKNNSFEIHKEIEIKQSKKSAKLWEENKECPICGNPINPDIFSCESGFHYCSDEHASEHVKANEPKGGY